MSDNSSENPMSVENRQAIFLALVESQDSGLGVVESRAKVALQFSVQVEDVKRIEKEGLTNQWPPL
jgi:hypothetical protein